LIYEEALPLAAIEAPIQRLKDGEEKMWYDNWNPKSA
jgi:hypothetical protein